MLRVEGCVDGGIQYLIILIICSVASYLRASSDVIQDSVTSLHEDHHGIMLLSGNLGMSDYLQE